MGTHLRSASAWLATAAIMVSGCSLIVGIPDRDYADAAPDGTMDGGRSVPEGGLDSAPIDARVLDGAQDSSDAGATFCQLLPATPAPLFCDDFEQWSASLSPWSLTGPTLDATEFSPPPSPGHSLLADVSVANGPNASTARWGPGAGYAGYANVELAFDLFIDGAPSDANTIVAVVEVDNFVKLVLQSNFGAGGAQVYEIVNGADGTPTNLATPVWRAQSWFRVDLKLHIVPGSASMLTAVTLQSLPNGMPEVAVSNLTLSTSWTKNPPVVTLQSAPQSSTSQDDRVHFDNVAVFGSN
jgi:hypothetical protein